MFNEQVIMSEIKEKKKLLNQKVGSLIEDTVTDTYTDILDILSAKIELAKLELSEQLADVISKIIILLVLLIASLYLVSAIAIFIGVLSGYPWLGYLIISSSIFLVILGLAKFKPDYLTLMIQKFLYLNQNS